MKALKGLVVFLGLLLVVGLGVLGYGLSTKAHLKGANTVAAKSSTVTVTATDFGAISIPLPAGSHLEQMVAAGDRVVLRTGSLTQAMRASMSVPGLMAPVEHQGRKLVDGGLVDNLPIAEVRKLCRPDVVIAVNVGSPLLAPAESWIDCTS